MIQLRLLRLFAQLYQLYQKSYANFRIALSALLHFPTLKVQIVQIVQSDFFEPSRMILD